MSVSPTLVKRFNKAAALAREGKHELAAEAYARVLTQPLPRGERREASPELVATVEMRRAWCLMDLQRYEEARAVLERAIELLSALDADDRWEYWFSYGNTLGNLGRTKEMNAAMDRALRIATDELADSFKAKRASHWRKVWRNSAA